VSVVGGWELGFGGGGMTLAGRRQKKNRVCHRGCIWPAFQPCGIAISLQTDSAPWEQRLAHCYL